VTTTTTTTIPQEKLRSIKTIFTHGNCSDGIASAIILRAALPDAEVVFLWPGSPDHRALRPASDSLLCDLSPHPDGAQEALEAGALVLDHHESAKDIVRPFVERGQGVFNTGKSGALLAYEEVYCHLIGQSWHNSHLRQLSVLASVHDLWQTDDCRWDDACKQHHTLLFFPVDHWLHKGQDFKFSDMEMQIGDIEYSKQQKSVERLANISFKTWWGGHNVAILNAISSTVSHVAERLRKTSKYKLCVGFSYITEHGEPKICLSVRSDGSFNVAEFCSHYGGGGHLCSGGFSLPVKEFDTSPYRVVTSLLDRFSVNATEPAPSHEFRVEPGSPPR
jgi:hypothetical protein